MEPVCHKRPSVPAAGSRTIGRKPIVCTEVHVYPFFFVGYVPPTVPQTCVPPLSLSPLQYDCPVHSCTNYVVCHFDFPFTGQWCIGTCNLVPDFLGVTSLCFLEFTTTRQSKVRPQEPWQQRQKPSPAQGSSIFPVRCFPDSHLAPLAWKARPEERCPLLIKLWVLRTVLECQARGSDRRATKRKRSYAIRKRANGNGDEFLLKVRRNGQYTWCECSKDLSTNWVDKPLIRPEEEVWGYSSSRRSADAVAVTSETSSKSRSSNL